MSEKHHYLPIFYQKRWAGKDKRICVYRKPHKEVKALRRHPDAVGFAYDLYTVPGVDYETASHLERRFFLQTDDEAAKALAIIERDGHSNINTKLRSAWARFVMSLIHRTPEEVKKVFEEIPRHVEYAERQFERDYAKLRYPEDPDTFEEYIKHRPTNPAGRAAIMLIQEIIDGRTVGNHLIQMNWAIFVPPSSFTFLTCDRPIIMTNGLAQSDGHIALPIGPRRLFIASNTTDILRHLKARKPDALVNEVNDNIVKQARHFVIGIDDAQLRFVANRFGTRKPSTPTETTPMPTPEEFARKYRVIVRP